jgi:hypothetical protein
MNLFAGRRSKWVARLPAFMPSISAPPELLGIALNALGILIEYLRRSRKFRRL